MVFNPRVQSSLGWAFGVILGATYEGLSTADIWASLREGAEAAGMSTVGLSGADVSVLRGYAGQMVQAADNLANADPGSLIDSSMVGRAPWSADPNQLAASPEYWARVEMTVADEEGMQTTSWATITGINSLQMTASDLNTLIQGDAEALALGQGKDGTPRGSLVSTGRVELLVAPGA